MSDTNWPAVIGLTGAAAFLIAIIGGLVLIGMNIRDERRRDRHAAHVDAMSRRPMDDASPADWAAWEAEYGEFICRRNHPSNWGQS